MKLGQSKKKTASKKGGKKRTVARAVLAAWFQARSLISPVSFLQAGEAAVQSGSDDEFEGGGKTVKMKKPKSSPKKKAKTSPKQKAQTSVKTKVTVSPARQSAPGELFCFLCTCRLPL